MCDDGADFILKKNTHTHKRGVKFFVGQMNGNIIGWYGEEERDCVDCIDCVKSKSVSRRRRQGKKIFWVWCHPKSSIVIFDFI